MATPLHTPAILSAMPQEPVGFKVLATAFFTVVGSLAWQLARDALPIRARRRE